MVQEFKLARYRNWGFASGCGPEFGQVFYVIIGNKCIFTALGYDFTSTINACEAIVEEIACLEECGIQDLEFYDLQTHVMYDSKITGKFEIDHIVIHMNEINDDEVDKNAIVIGSSRGWEPGWNRVNLDPTIIELFQPCIGQLGQKRTTEEAQDEIAEAYCLVLTIPELN